jgi:SNF2 family DNA or RNA helicase
VQHLKNPSAAVYQAVKNLSLKRIFLLTGTPLQNSPADIWVLSELCNPGLMSSRIQPAMLDSGFTGKSGRFELIREKQDEKQKSELGHYFLRTKLNVENEANLWDIYNTIREIESTFRCLKTDLDLRPIYPKNDNSTKSHLHLALLAYWLVNRVRYQLKAKGINHSWTEITRIASTQKLVTTQAKNTLDQTIQVKACSVPEPKLKVLIDALGHKHIPFKPQKSEGQSPPLGKNQPPLRQKVMDG